MGLFDELKCEYLLPLAGANEHLYQTKSFEEPFMESYELRADGTLWKEGYDVEDRSDPKAEGLLTLRGCMTRVNQRWEPTRHTGEVRFYHWTGEKMIEWSAYFVRGELKHLEPIEPVLRAEEL